MSLFCSKEHENIHKYKALLSHYKVHVYFQTAILFFICTFCLSEVTKPEISGRKYAFKIICIFIFSKSNFEISSCEVF